MNPRPGSSLIVLMISLDLDAPDAALLAGDWPGAAEAAGALAPPGQI
jgi:hypothetical protein